jgi:hypothetical protein
MFEPTETQKLISGWNNSDISFSRCLKTNSYNLGANLEIKIGRNEDEQEGEMRPFDESHAIPCCPIETEGSRVISLADEYKNEDPDELNFYYSENINILDEPETNFQVVVKDISNGKIKIEKQRLLEEYSEEVSSLSTKIKISFCKKETTNQDIFELVNEQLQFYFEQKDLRMKYYNVKKDEQRKLKETMFGYMITEREKELLEKINETIYVIQYHNLKNPRNPKQLKEIITINNKTITEQLIMLIQQGHIEKFVDKCPFGLDFYTYDEIIYPDITIACSIYGTPSLLEYMYRKGQYFGTNELIHMILTGNIDNMKWFFAKNIDYDVNNLVSSIIGEIEVDLFEQLCEFLFVSEYVIEKLFDSIEMIEHVFELDNIWINHLNEKYNIFTYKDYKNKEIYVYTLCKLV